MPISLTPARKWATVLLLVLLGVIGVTGQVEASDGMREGGRVPEPASPPSSSLNMN